MLARPGRNPALIALLLALATGAGGVMPGDSLARKVLLVTTARLPAYEECAEGIRSALDRAGIGVVIAEAGSREMELALLAPPGSLPLAVVAIGSAAHEAVGPYRAKLPTVTTMVLGPAPPGGPGPGAESGPPRATVTLEVPPALTLEQIRRLFPDRRRIGLIRGPRLPAPRAQAIAAAARRGGLAVTVIDCSDPEQLVAQFASWRGRFDFLWLLPDPDLYRGQTVPALVLAGIRQGLPVIGFSEGLVRAGALVGLYPDYRDIGLQTGEAVLRLIDGQPQEPLQFPRKAKTTINPNIMRALGIPATGPLKDHFLSQ